MSQLIDPSGQPVPTYCEWMKVRHPAGYVVARKTPNMVARYSDQHTFFSQKGLQKEDAAYERMVAERFEHASLAEIVQVFLAEVRAPSRVQGNVEGGLRLALEAAVAKLDGTHADEDKETIADVQAYCADARGVLLVSRSEQSYIWDRWHQKMGYTWIENRQGISRTIGYVGDAGVHCSFFSAVVGGAKIIFVDATSVVVDYDLVRAFLDKNMPASAFGTNGRLVFDDGGNEHIVFHAVCQAPEKAAA